MLNIIIRGYGVPDQSADVFATLCNYAGYRAFFTRVAPAGRPKLVLALVRVGQSWHIFDTNNGVYFRNKRGALAGMQDIALGDWTGQSSGPSSIDYPSYFSILRQGGTEMFARSNIQSPLRRLLYQVKNAFSRLCQRR